jgi:hypothetical protein
MGISVTNAAGATEQELDVESAASVCVCCGKPLAIVLDQLGSLRCHDCRDGYGSDSLGGTASGR